MILTEYPLERNNGEKSWTIGVYLASYAYCSEVLNPSTTTGKVLSVSNLRLEFTLLCIADVLENEATITGVAVEGLIDGLFEGAAVGVRVEGFTEGVNVLGNDGLTEVGILLGERDDGFKVLGMTEGFTVRIMEGSMLGPDVVGTREFVGSDDGVLVDEDTVGTKLRAALGIIVGTRLDGVGEIVGLLVAEGIKLGEVDGELVGPLLLGVRVGILLDGTKDGAKLNGAIDGNELEGRFVGLIVVGVTDGEKLG